MKKFEEKTLSTKEIYKGKIIRLQVDEVELPDGKTSKREIVRHQGAVAVIPVTAEGKIIMVEQYRKPLEKSIIEVPAGKLEAGESPDVTAIRELEEETGYTTKPENLTFVDSFYTSPGFADEIMYIYFTDKLEKLEKPVEVDDDEFLELVEMSLDEALEAMKEQRIHDAKTNYAMMYLKASGRLSHA